MLSFEAVNDRGYVYVEDEFVGVLARQQNILELGVSIRAGERLTVIVESQGRIAYGENINDFKVANSWRSG